MELSSIITGLGLIYIIVVVFGGVYDLIDGAVKKRKQRKSA